MKKTQIILMLIIGVYTECLQAQNIISNGGFEQYDTCPNMEGQLHFVIGWESWLATPDYFNACATGNVVNVPNSWYYSYQYAHNGNAYCGLFNYWTEALIPSPYTYVRDLIGIQLNQVMQINTKYYFSMYVSLASFIPSPCSSNKIGAKFTTQSYAGYGTDSLYSPLVNNFAHWHYDSLITDTANWVHLTGSFIADSAYQYLVLGNFFDDFNTDTLIMGPSSLCYSYFFIDDVCVSTDSLTCLPVGIHEWNNNNNAKVYPNPIRDEAVIEIPEGWSEFKLLLRDLMGRNVLVDFESIERNRVKMSKRDLSNGMYYLSLFHDDEIITIKLIVDH